VSAATTAKTANKTIIITNIITITAAQAAIA